ncbi:hypothetical protein BWK49_28330 [Mycobacterium intracellulare subsp. chimaera]|nr:hypothetical protein BWK49_28330 [Mycobacterium intracellulare subsp. chimaera]
MLNVGDAFAQHFDFAFQHTCLSHRGRRDGLRNSRQTVASAHRFDQGWAELVNRRRGRPSRPIAAERGFVGTRLCDIGVGVVGGRNRDGAEQVDDVGVMAPRRRLEQGYVGGQPDVGRNPPSCEVGDKQRGGAVVAEACRP